MLPCIAVCHHQYLRLHNIRSVQRSSQFVSHDHQLTLNQEEEEHRFLSLSLPISLSAGSPLLPLVGPGQLYVTCAEVLHQGGKWLLVLCPVPPWESCKTMPGYQSPLIVASHSAAISLPTWGDIPLSRVASTPCESHMFPVFSSWMLWWCGRL